MGEEARQGRLRLQRGAPLFLALVRCVEAYCEDRAVAGTGQIWWSETERGTWMLQTVRIAVEPLVRALVLTEVSMLRGDRNVLQ